MMLYIVLCYSVLGYMSSSISLRRISKLIITLMGCGPNVHSKFGSFAFPVTIEMSLSALGLLPQMHLLYCSQAPGREAAITSNGPVAEPPRFSVGAANSFFIRRC